MSETKAVILRMLLDGPAQSCDMRRRMGVACDGAIHSALGELVDAGLILGPGTGNRGPYALHPLADAGALAAHLDGHRHPRPAIPRHAIPPRSREILDYLSPTASVNYRDVARAFDMTDPAASSCLATLVKTGWVERVSPGVYRARSWDAPNRPTGGKDAPRRKEAVVPPSEGAANAEASSKVAVAVAERASLESLAEASHGGGIDLVVDLDLRNGGPRGVLLKVGGLSRSLTAEEAEGIAAHIVRCARTVRAWGEG